jgi:far upstream element-binding protein
LIKISFICSNSIFFSNQLSAGEDRTLDSFWTLDRGAVDFFLFFSHLLVPLLLSKMSSEALKRAREIAAKLSGECFCLEGYFIFLIPVFLGSLGGGGGGGSNFQLNSELGKRKNRWGEDEAPHAAPGLGAFKTKKLYIPWREHPEINFLGLLIGPKGITQKKFQDTTGAKYQIRGLGAAKDGGPSNTGHPDDTDELHVVVEGTNDAVDRACKELEKFLYNPAEAAKLKAEQLKQLADMNNQVSSQNYTVEEVYSGGSAESFTLEILVPNNMVGLIIGKGGDNILRIHSQLGVQSHIAKEADMKPGETMRSIVLKGVQDNVHEAKKRIEEIVSQRVAQLRGNTGNNQQKDEMNHAFIVKLPVLNDKIGIVIGKGGSTIKGIQDRTKTIVKIPHGPDEDNPQVRTVLIGGDSKEGVDACQMEIFLALQMQQQSAQMAYNSIANAMNVVIPDDKTAIVIGKGGCNVKDIQGRLNVKIQIPHGADIGSNPPTRTISLVGSPEMQTLAKYEIELLASGTSLHVVRANAESYSNPAAWAAAAAAVNPYGAYGADPDYAAAAYQQMTAAAGYYADPNNAAALYAQSLAGSSDPQQQAAAAALLAGSTSATTAETTEVPTDPTAYYNDYWYYATFYGEAAARVYYGAWSPPEGTKPPEGMVIPTDPAATTAVAGTVPSATTEATPQSEQQNNQSSDGEKNAAAEKKEGEGEKVAGETTATSAEDVSEIILLLYFFLSSLHLFLLLLFSSLPFLLFSS